VNFLGIDIGTSGTRAIVIDETGTVLACEVSEHPPFDSPQIGWAEQSPDDWWDACVIAVRRIVHKVSADSIGGVSFSGQMHGSVLLGEGDRPLRPALLWCDQRTVEQCDQIMGMLGKERLLSLVANPAITGFTLPKLLWVKQNEPEIWSRVRSILLPKDYVRLRLTGAKFSDVADSSGTLLFDVANRKWSSEMLDAFEIDSSFLPTVVESPEPTGNISAAAAAETGLKQGTLVFGGAGDNAAGAIGMGVISPGTVSATIGTSGVIFGVTERPSVDPHGRIHTLCHAIPGRWHNTGVTLSAGLSLNWFRSNFANGVSYEELGSIAEQAPSGSDGAIWLPYLMGERTPHLDPNARAAFVGLTASHTLSHLVRAVMEGVAFSLRDSLEIFKELGAPIERIRLGGGGAKSIIWRQIQADIFGQPVEILAGDEGAAFGAAILAGVGAGVWGSVDAACEHTVKVIETVHPRPSNKEGLDRNYEMYRRLYPALRQAGDHKE
jgi:xylulokinase